jgi:hypothetical protein
LSSSAGCISTDASPSTSSPERTATATLRSLVDASASFADYVKEAAAARRSSARAQDQPACDRALGRGTRRASAARGDGDVGLPRRAARADRALRGRGDAGHRHRRQAGLFGRQRGAAAATILR